MQVLSTLGATKPRAIMRTVLTLSIALIVAVVVPSLFPQATPMLNPLKIDTDPENMLPVDEPVRIFHNQSKRDFGLYDMVVVGVVDEKTPAGVFTVETLSEIYDLTEFAKSLQWQDDQGQPHGVIEVDVMSPSTVDNIEQAGLGAVSFNWLMEKPPVNEEDAAAVAKAAGNLPLLNGTLVSEDGKAIALYLPIHSKNDSFDVAKKLKARFSTYDGPAQYYITGLPVAQDQFGVEMFVQMAISAPAAMVLIFLLMWVFFRQWNLIVAPMLVAMASVIVTMGALVVTGQTVHIMSSMIPIFIMPIAVLDAVHILSDFFDRYRETRDRRATLTAVMKELSTPMFFTSLTTFAGFGSLALTPIPPVQVFGVFVAIGVMVAWLLTITMVPAYIMLMKESSFSKFGLDAQEEGKQTPLVRFLQGVGGFTFGRAKLILMATLAVGVLSYFGIQKIEINDNPVKWFNESHDIRVADKALNERFAGTYMAYLVLESAGEEESLEDFANALAADFGSHELQPVRHLAARIPSLSAKATDQQGLVDALRLEAQAGLERAEGDDWIAWDDALIYLDGVMARQETFKSPEVLTYLEGFQSYLLETGLVGKSSGLTDVVKTVHRELLEGEASAFRIPSSRSGVAQTLLTFQNSHRPQDLWHFVTPDYKRANLWIQLKSGDNRDMSALIEAVDSYFEENPAPQELHAQWFGLTYINVIWQQKMVSGMVKAFLGSFVVVLLLMTLLFRSVLWGLLAMVPLTVTIGVIYAIIGYVGKDYDMPVAVLSSLSLGLAVDYAIHFLARSRQQRERFASWQETVPAVFGEPARAIARNVIVLGIGFLPLLAAPLVPYKTVGVFISAILALAGIATLFILPALVRVLSPVLFREPKGDVS